MPSSRCASPPQCNIANYPNCRSASLPRDLIAELPLCYLAVLPALHLSTGPASPLATLPVDDAATMAASDVVFLIIAVSPERRFSARSHQVCCTDAVMSQYCSNVAGNVIWHRYTLQNQLDGDFRLAKAGRSSLPSSVVTALQCLPGVLGCRGLRSIGPSRRMGVLASPRRIPPASRSVSRPMNG